MPRIPPSLLSGLLLCTAAPFVPASLGGPVQTIATSQESPAELHRKGLDAFFQVEDMPAAEAFFRQALEHPEATGEQRSQSHFYLVAALGRQSHDEQALAESKRWLANYPKGSSAATMTFYQGSFLQNLGQREEARKVWQQLLIDYPDSSVAETTQMYLDAPASATQRAAPRPPSRLKGILVEGQSGRGGYVAVRVGLDPSRERDRIFLRVAEQAARFHEGRVLDFDGHDFAALAEDLARLNAQHVLFVLAPETLDITFHRRVLLASTGLDEDVFPDFEFGYFTAKNGAQLEALWQRTRSALQLEEHGRRWMSTAVSNFSQVVADSVPLVAQAAGFHGDQIYWSIIESDPDVLSFVDEHLPDLERADVIEITGNGDPQGIWVFSDRRNIDRSQHWDYASELVGQHPEQMPRILAPRFAALKLSSPIVWSGTCHSAATRRVFVEGDIVSTFGSADGVTVHRLEPESSLCLSFIEAGALALLAPIAANHGMSVSMEEDFAFLQGADLGATVKSTYDDVLLAAEGNLRLELPEEGSEAASVGEEVMQGGGSNRLLIGDPALSPFPKVERPGENVQVLNRTEGSFDVVIERDAGWHARAWDIFGSNRGEDWRIETQIDLEGLVPEGKRLEFGATLIATTLEGKSLPYTLRHCEPERFHGQRFLHLQANAARGAVQNQSARLVFTVTYR